ncbi:MAG: peptide-methionine (R)-S-oxide reductase MsrB [Halieaceae bacterium]
MKDDGGRGNDLSEKDDGYWREQLTSDEYTVLREKGTERAFTGEYWNVWEEGTYHCRGCGEVLFQSDTKFDAGCGWPSFDRPASEGVIEESRDTSHGMIRTEVLCQKCGGHLGHVFPDGPTETGQRYCINSLSITLEKDARD